MDMEIEFELQEGKRERIKMYYSQNLPKDCLYGGAAIYSPSSLWDNAQAGIRREHSRSQSVSPYLL